MLIQLGLLIIGFIILIKGADIFVDGATIFAIKHNVPEIVVGLTIVAFGTSAPEAAVSISSAYLGNSDLSISNVIGSNIINVLLVLGVTGLFTSLNVNRNTYRFEIPFVVFITSMLLVLGYSDGVIDRWDGVVLWGLFLIFMGYLFILMKQDSELPVDSVEDVDLSIGNVKLASMIFIGMIMIVLGSNVAVRGATGLAQGLGVSNRIIGLTVVALGTSLPELITSLTAARKGSHDLGVGNILGSNIFNILFVLGTTALVSPLAIPFTYDLFLDGIVAMASVILFFTLVNRSLSLNRNGAIILLVGLGLYLITIL